MPTVLITCLLATPCFRVYPGTVKVLALWFRRCAASEIQLQNKLGIFTWKPIFLKSLAVIKSETSVKTLSSDLNSFLHTESSPTEYPAAMVQNTEMGRKKIKKNQVLGLNQESRAVPIKENASPLDNTYHSFLIAWSPQNYHISSTNGCTDSYTGWLLRVYY